MHTRAPDAARLILPCLTAAFLSAAITSAQQAPAPAQPRFADGEAQVVEAFNDPKEWIRHDLWVETTFDSDADGKPDRMHVAVTRQKQTETEGLKVPVVYETSPYFAGTGSTDKQYFWNPEHELGAEPPARNDKMPVRTRAGRPVISNSQVRTWVPRGFAVVHSSSPGTGLSQGCPTVGGDNESLAPKAVIDWLCGRAKGYASPDGDELVEASWCTGKVGMTGTSYNGTLPIAAATTGVDGLMAIIPIAPNTSYYHYYRSHGLVRHPGGYMGEDIDVLYDFINSGDPARRDDCNRRVRDGELKALQDRITGDWNEFWAGRDYLLDLGPMKAATLMAHGFNDWNVMPEHSVRIYAALKAKGVPAKAFFHQGGHGGSPPLWLMNRWFTRFLYGVDNGIEDAPRAWIVREDATRAEPTPYADYPNPDAQPVTLLLTPGGRKAGGLAPAVPQQHSLEKLVDDVSKDGAELAQAAESKHRLLYVTPELSAPVHVSGSPRLTIKVASSKKAANLSVWLVSLPWTRSRNPNANIITRGWADPQNHASLSESAPLKPGEFYTLTFDLQPDDQVIPAGQRIGLMIFASDRDFTLWPRPGTELTVDVSATSLELPVVGGSAAWESATAGGK